MIHVCPQTSYTLLGGENHEKIRALKCGVQKGKGQFYFGEDVGSVKGLVDEIRCLHSSGGKRVWTVQIVQVEELA